MATGPAARTRPLEFQRSINNGTGNQNTAIGVKMLYGHIQGNHNIAWATEPVYNVGGMNQQSDNNIEIGSMGDIFDNNTIRIGDVQTKTFIAGISGAAVAGSPVVVDANGQLGTATSSARFKKDIKPMDKASEAILALKPVSFQYRSDPKGTRQFGLIAEEVAKVNPDLVTRDRNGEIYSVRYEAVNAMLLNEFLKEHKAFVEEQRKCRSNKRRSRSYSRPWLSNRKTSQRPVEQLTTRLDEQELKSKR